MTTTELACGLWHGVPFISKQSVLVGRLPDFGRAPAHEGVSEIKRFLSGTFKALSSRDYRLFATGQAISISGTWMQKLAQTWLVLELTNSAFMLGLTVACQALPTLLFTATGGSLADRFDRRRILIATALLGMWPALALGAIVRLDVAALWMVLMAALFQGTVDALERPTRMTLVNDIVGPRLLANAVTLNNVIQNAGKLVGPAVGGLLIGTVGLASAFFVNAASYVAVLVGLLLIRPAYAGARTAVARGSVRDTLRYAAGRRDIAASLMMLAFIGLFGYNFPVLAPILIRDVFGGDATSVGLAFTCMGIGGVSGGLALAGKMKGSAWTQLVSAGCFGGAMVLTALAPTMGLAFGALFVVGAASVIFTSASGAYLQLTTDPPMRGRVMALYVIALAGTSPIGAPLQGTIAELTSARIALLVAAIATAFACIATYRYLRVSHAQSLEAKPAVSAKDVRAVEIAKAGVTDAT